MNIMARIVTIAALCVGFAPMVTAATVKVQLIKTDPQARKKTWSYQVRSKKNADSTVSSTQLKTFTRDTKASIDASNYENILRVYPNRTGAFGPNGQVLYKELNLIPTVLQELQGQNGVALDEHANMIVQPIAEIKKLVANKDVKVRKISVVKVGNNTDQWTVESYLDGVKYGTVVLKKVVSGTTEQSRTRSLTVPIIPKGGILKIKIVKPHNVYNWLEFNEGQAADLKTLRLDNNGQQTALLEF